MINGIITTWLQTIEQIAGGNQMVAGAITLWAMSVLTYLARGVPVTVATACWRHMATSMTLNNGGWVQEQTMFNFMAWLQPRTREGFSRTLSVESADFSGGSPKLGIGYGTHLFFHNRRLYWISKGKLESSGSERQKEEVIITTFGRSHKPFRQLLAEFAPQSTDGQVSIYRMNMEGEWMKYASPPKRYLNTVAAPQQMKAAITGQIRHFKESREWFISRGLPYKLTYLIHGVPGGGKTSLVKALACEFGMNICAININDVSDKSLEKGLASTPKNSVVIIEDFDSGAATKNRAQTKVAVDGDSMMMQSLTLTGLLNALDGVVPLDDCVVFLTTNHLDSIDPALYRKGRVDHLVEIGKVPADEVRRHTSHLYPSISFEGVEFLPTLGCLLNEALLEGKEDPEAFVTSLVRNGCARRVHKLSLAAGVQA